MSEELEPLPKIVQAMNEGRLFWLDSMANQNRLDFSCPYVKGAVCLYLFDLKDLEHLRDQFSQELYERTTALLLLGGGAEHPSSTTDSRLTESQAADTERGRSLFVACLDAYEEAVEQHTQAALFTTPEFQWLTRYFALRLRLHWRLPAPTDLPAPDKLAKLNDALIYCALSFHLGKANDQHAVAKVQSLYQSHRSAGHLFWLQCLIHKNDNQLDRAKGYWLMASQLPHFDENLLEERQHLFDGGDRPARLTGLRATKRPYLYGQRDAAEALGPELYLPDFLQQEVDASRQEGKLSLSIKRALVEHRQFKPYQNLDLEQVSYVTPEDFLRTFVFVFPTTDPFRLALALSGVKHTGYVFQNLPSLVSRSLGKLDETWPQARDLQTVVDNAAFIRRVWRSYETGVYGIPAMTPVVGFQKTLEHWDFVRQVWPKSARLLIVPNRGGKGIVDQLALKLDDDTLVCSLDNASDCRRLTRRLKIHRAQFARIRQRIAGWRHTLMPEVA
jgi:hypothetical protein